VSVDEYPDGGVEAVAVLEVYLALGAVPEVDGLGEEGVVLGLEEVLEEVVDDGNRALVEVLALGGLTLTTAG
jgi:O-phosphoseryl-tRNA(Cys) synthetase